MRPSQLRAGPCPRRKRKTRPAREPSRIQERSVRRGARYVRAKPTRGIRRCWRRVLSARRRSHLCSSASFCGVRRKEANPNRELWPRRRAYHRRKIPVNERFLLRGAPRRSCCGEVGPWPGWRRARGSLAVLANTIDVYEVERGALTGWPERTGATASSRATTNAFAPYGAAREVDDLTLRRLKL